MSKTETIHLPNRFDYSIHRTFTERYKSLLEQGDVDEIVLDFSQVQYLDSAALGLMVLFRNRAEGAAKKTKIAGARGSCRDILQIANMQNIFEFVN